MFEDICRVVKSSAPAGVKVILETSALTHEEKIIGCSLSKLAGAAFVKTSTGFGKGGATVEDIQLMRSIVGGELGVKASGGVRTAEDALKMARRRRQPHRRERVGRDRHRHGEGRRQGQGLLARAA